MIRLIDFIRMFDMRYGQRLEIMDYWKENEDGSPVVYGYIDKVNGLSKMTLDILEKNVHFFCTSAVSCKDDIWVYLD